MKVLLTKWFKDLCEDCCNGDRVTSLSPLIYQTGKFLADKDVSIVVEEFEDPSSLNIDSYDVVICFSSLVGQGLNLSRNILERAKKQQKITVFCLHYSMGELEREILQDSPYIDFAVTLEDRELGLLELIQNIEKTSFSENSGIFYRKTGDVSYSGRRKAVRDLNHLTSSVGFLQKNNFNYYKHSYLTVGRGCPAPCTFCNMRLTPSRKRPIEDIIDELQFLGQSVREIEIVDPDLHTNEEWAVKLYESIIQSGLKIDWSGDLRAEEGHDLEILKLMKRSGCEKMAIGIETLDEIGRESIGKGNTVEDVRLAMKTIRKAGIVPTLNFMVGFWWDSDTTLQKIMDICVEFKNYHAHFPLVRPWRGLPLYDQFRERDLIDKELTYKDYIHSRNYPVAGTLYLNKDEVLRWQKRLKSLYFKKSLFRRINKKIKREFHYLSRVS